jgi:hypothetical protein
LRHEYDTLETNSSGQSCQGRCGISCRRTGYRRKSKLLCFQNTDRTCAVFERTRWISSVVFQEHLANSDGSGEPWNVVNRGPAYVQMREKCFGRNRKELTVTPMVEGASDEIRRSQDGCCRIIVVLNIEDTLDSARWTCVKVSILVRCVTEKTTKACDE